MARIPRLYLDTSAIVARYHAEAHTLTAALALEEAAELASSHAAYAETCSALARLKREKRLAAGAYCTALAQFEPDWAAFLRLEVGDSITRLAGALAEPHALKGYDAIHLATALALARQPEGAVFLSYDARLNRAAKAEGLALWTA